MRAASVCAFLLACGGPSRSMVEHATARRTRGLEVFAVDALLVVRMDQPGGANLVFYDPVREGDRIVLVAGVHSGGRAGVAVQCFDVGALAPTTHWTVGWRDPDGALIDVEVTRGERAADVAAECPSR